jgi:tetratricopeptide (TPR) repeat protein
MVLNEPVYAVIRVDSLNPGDGLRLSNHIKVAGRRFVVFYDPSPIEAYYKPEAMQRVKHGTESDDITTLRKLIESVKDTLKELIEVRNAWVVVILPRELYEQVQRGKEEDVDLRQVLDNLERDVVTVNLKDEGFLREVIKKYSGCDDVSDDLVRRVMNFDSYTLVAKYVGIWLREKKCEVEDVEKALRESADKPKLFFAHYIWGIILGKSMDLAMKVSVPLILHAAFGPIPEGITYITKAVNKDGTWKLIDRNELAESKLEDLREDDLEPIAKWLSTLHEDLIEETLQELVGLRGEEARNNYRNHGFENLIKTLNRSYHEKALEEVRGLSREVKPEEVESNLLIFVGERLKHALKPYTDCWKRAAFIIGAALVGRDSVPRLKDLPESLTESFGDTLRRCGVDDYLLVGNEIPPLIWYLTKHHAYALAEAFVDKYDKAVAEIKRVLYIASKRGRIYDTEGFYGLGLASIIAKAVESGKPIEPSDADAALRIASNAIRYVASPDLTRPILRALEPLRGKAPQRYLELLAPIPEIENLDSDTARYILNELNEVLGNYGDVVRGYAWSLVHAIRAYANLLWVHRSYFDDKVGDVVGRVVDLLNRLDRFKSSLGVIAWAYALAPALEYYEDIMKLMMKTLRINEVDKVINKANEVAKELGRLRKKAKELIRDEEFMGYVESKSVKINEKAVKIVILEASSNLKYALARYRLDNNELDEAEKLFKKAANELRKIGDYKNYLTARSWVSRVEAIKGSLVGEKLVNEFRRLYEETFNKKPFMRTAHYLNTASFRLGEYLVSLALTGNYEKIGELLEKHWRVLNANKQVSVLTRLMLNILLGSKDRKDQLGSELEGKLSVYPEELINAFGFDMHREFLPALRVAFGILRPEDGYKECKSIEDSMKRRDCKGAVLAAADDSDAIWWLRWKLLHNFNDQISEKEKSGWLKGLSLDSKSLVDKFMELMNGLNSNKLDGKSLVQLIAPYYSTARLALMLHALINRNGNLTKAHALYKAVVTIGYKLPARLFLEAYKECCDLESESFRRAIAGLFFYHV